MTADFSDTSMQPVFSVAGVRAIDKAAIDGGVVGSYALMTRAAQFALDVAVTEFAGVTEWLVLCGGGNNAGDGYVLARLALAEGISVNVVELADPARLRGDAARARSDFVAEDGRVEPWDGTLEPGSGLLVDAMLGSGLDRDVAGAYRAAVDALNGYGAPVLALDVPTGLHGDTGAVMGAAINADVTATFVGRKAGLYLGAGPDNGGRLRYSALGLPASCSAGVQPVMRLVTPSLLQDRLPRRPRQSHKGDFGHVLVIGGAPGMPGAARLAGEAALKSGAGRVSVATHASSAAVIPAGRPELMCHAVDDAAALAPLLDAATVIAVGPGLGQSDWSAMLLAAAEATGKPLVADADALNLMARCPERRGERIVTPHPGEAARLLDSSAAVVQLDRLAALAALKDRLGGTVVLKGNGTLVSSADGPPWLNLSGNPGMASAGMGDVLTGIIAGLLAQGLDPESAAIAGVHVHGCAADVAASNGGERGLIASDVLDELRPWLNP
ncbi:MAG: NAD(P)H-hydrate dehydratase [Woeseia sp.]